MIVDAFMYCGEIECLEIRVREYEGLVDRHLLIEGSHTFQGKERRVTPKADLRKISPKIEQAVYSHWIDCTPWERENNQRSAIKECLEPDDIVLISDADEIVRRSVLEEALNPVHRCTAFDLDQFYYHLNLKDEAETVITARLIEARNITKISYIRNLQPMLHELVVPNAGWHFSWLGGVPRMQEKLFSFSHTELNTPEINDAGFLRSCIDRRFTLHNGHLLTRVPIDETFPLLIQEQPERFKDLLA